MDRRLFIKRAALGGVGAAAATTLAAPAIAQSNPKIKLAPGIIVPEIARHDLWRRRGAVEISV